jgi:glycosyltransferase involved in cell wall biosynthesis
MMKILMGTHAVPSLKSGGLLTQILNTKKYLEQIGVSVELYNGWDSIDHQKVDLFHLFWANPATHFLGSVMKEQGIKTVVTPVFFSRHNPRALSWIHAFGRVLSRMNSIQQGHVLTSDLCKKADMNLPNTRKEAELLNKGLGVPDEKIRMVPNGVEERFYHADPSLFKKKYNLENFILYAGHIGTGRKNTLKFLMALRNIDHPAVLIGPLIRSPYADLCMEEAGKNKNILILPEVKGDSPLLESAYAACDVFILPSLFETPGIAALEAGLAGAKIVITRYGGTEEYFGEYAVYTDPNSVASIRSAVQKALNKTRDNLLQEHIHKNFLWERVAKETSGIYEELARQGG